MDLWNTVGGGTPISRQGVAVWQWGCFQIPEYFSAQKFPSIPASAIFPRPHAFILTGSPSPQQTVSGWSTSPNSQGSPQSLPFSPHSRISAEMHPSYHLPRTPRRARPPSSGHPGHGQPAPFRLPARAVRIRRPCRPFDPLLRT